MALLPSLACHSFDLGRMCSGLTEASASSCTTNENDDAAARSAGSKDRRLSASLDYDEAIVPAWRRRDKVLAWSMDSSCALLRSSTDAASSSNVPSPLSAHTRTKLVHDYLSCPANSPVGGSAASKAKSLSLFYLMSKKELGNKVLALPPVERPRGTLHLPSV